MIRLLRTLWYDFRHARFLRSEYDITLLEAWRIVRWCRIYEEEEDCFAHPEEMARRLVRERHGVA